MPPPSRENTFLTLSSPVRLRLLAALAAGPASIAEISKRSGVSTKNAGNQLIELRASGLVTSEKLGHNKVIHSIAAPHTVTADGSLDLGICVVRLGRVR